MAGEGDIPDALTPQLPPGAEKEMPGIAEVIHDRFLEKFPAAHREKTLDLIRSKQYFLLFRHIEDLIAARALDDLMTDIPVFRRLMHAVYGLRHPRLQYDDVGVSIEQEVADAEHERRRRERVENKDSEAEVDAKLAETLARFRAEGVDFGFDREMARKTPEVSGAGAVPLAPARGGPAPRQPYTTGWTYRAARPGARIAFDPKATCDQFLPGGWAPRPRPEPFSADSGLLRDLDEEDFAVTSGDEEEEEEEYEEEGYEGEEGSNDLADENSDRDVEMGSDTVLGAKFAEILTTVRHRRRLRTSGRDSTQLRRWSTTKTQDGASERYDDESRVLGSSADTTPVSPHPQQGDFGFQEDVAESEDVAMGGVEDTTSEAPAGPELPEPGVYDEHWLLKYLEASDSATPEELGMVLYQGWKIHSPKVQLIRIKNFLSDEDRDRTKAWEVQFAEISVYLQHLREKVWDGTQSWGWLLKECTAMLQTHWVYEEINYGKTKLDLNFKPPVFRKRLQTPVGAQDIRISATLPKDELKPRYLHHRIPESIHDVDYQIPGPLLRSRFLNWYRGDVTRVWNVDPYSAEQPGCGSRGLLPYHTPSINMAVVEDETYEKCIRKGTLETSRALHEECNFAFTNNSWFADERGAVLPNGDAICEWSRFRGAKRAAVQQCLSAFDNTENTDLISPFRKLVLPISLKEKKRIEEEARHKLVYPCHAIKEPPKGEDVDPFLWTHWHRQLMDNHEQKAKLTFHDAQRRWQNTAMNKLKTDNQRVDLTSCNFLGPYVPSFLYRDVERQRQEFHELGRVYNLLHRAHRRAPRPLLAELLEYVEYAMDEDYPGIEVEEQFRAVEEEVARQDKRDGVERRPLSEDQLWWLHHVAGPSTNKQLLAGRLPGRDHAHAVFLRRIDALLDGTWPRGVLAKYNKWYSVDKITEAIRGHTHSSSAPPRATYRFDDNYVEKCCTQLAAEGVLRRKVKKGIVVFSRPLCDMHPESRINWYALDMVDEHGRRVHDERLDLDRLPPGTERSVLPWEAADAARLMDESDLLGDGDAPLEERALTAFRIIGFRLGQNLDRARDAVFRAYEELEEDGLGEKPCVTVDLHLLHTRDMQNMMWRGSATARRSSDTVTYGAVVRAAAPALHKPHMSQDTYSLAAVELVRRNKIRELSEAGNMRWPVRETWHADEATGTWEKTYRRETIWDFARPRGRDVGMPRKKFFSLDRWPVHVQTKERRAEIRRGREGRGAAADVEYSVEAAQESAGKLATSRAVNEAVKEAVFGLLDKQRMERDEAERERMAQAYRAAAVSAEDAVDPKYRFVHGETEFWRGDTPRQKKAIEERLRGKIERLLPGASDLRPSEAVTDPGEPEIALPEIPPSIRIPQSVAPPPASKPGVQVDSESESDIDTWVARDELSPIFTEPLDFGFSMSAAQAFFNMAAKPASWRAEADEELQRRVRELNERP